MEDRGSHINWFSICIVSAVCFKLVNEAVLFVFPPPQGCRQHWKKIWLWQNICTSFIHSSLSATLAVYSLYQSPEMLNNMINTWNVLGYSTLALSMGYFLYDLINIIIYDRQKALCIMIHHVLVFLIFYVAVSNKLYIPFAIASLLMEINSIFLHTRRIMHMSNFTPDALALKVNCIMLTVTFVAFRLIACGWMVNFLVMHRNSLHQLHLFFGVLGMVVVIPQNIFLLKQVWLSDAKRRTQLSTAENEKAMMKDSHSKNASNFAKLKHFLQMIIDRTAD